MYDIFAEILQSIDGKHLPIFKSAQFGVIVDHAGYQLYYIKVDIHMQWHFIIIVIYYESFAYINNVYRLILNLQF